MYICICNRVTTAELELDYESAIARCGTQCGKCIQWIELGVYPGTDKPIDPSPPQ